MMKMQISEATLTPLLLGNRNGANSSAAKIASIKPLRGAPPGGLSETTQPSHDGRFSLSGSGRLGEATVSAALWCAAPCTASWGDAVIAASMMFGQREQAARSPQQNQCHQQNVGSERQFRREETHIVGGQADQDRADETAADRAEAADDQNDEHQDGHAVADLARDDGLILCPHHAADAGKRGPGHEHANEHAADVITERLDHLAIFDAGAHHKAQPGASEEQM